MNASKLKAPKAKTGKSSKNPNRKQVFNSPDLAARLFNCTEGERAAFEAGIKLGTLYHQYVGAPVSMDSVASLERAMEEAAMVQPFVEEAQVCISREPLERAKSKGGQYDYVSLDGKMISAKLLVRYGSAAFDASLKLDQDMDYPLMSIIKRQ